MIIIIGITKKHPIKHFNNKNQYFENKSLHIYRLTCRQLLGIRSCQNHHPLLNCQTRSLSFPQNHGPSSSQLLSIIPLSFKVCNGNLRIFRPIFAIRKFQVFIMYNSDSSIYIIIIFKSNVKLFGFH